MRGFSARLVVVLVLFAAPLAGQRAPAPSRPNIVLIVADDLGYGDLGSYGAPDVRTPNLDRLAREGVRLTDYYANAAVCTPTRAALITGRYQQRVLLERPLDTAGGLEEGLPVTGRSLPQLLKNAGYATGLVGKWHLGFKPDYHPNRHGFDYFWGYLAGYIDWYTHVRGDGQSDLWENTTPVEQDGYFGHEVTARATRFITDHARGPFFLEVAYGAPHWPFQSPHHSSVAVRKNNSMFQQPADPDPPTRNDYVEILEDADAGVGQILETLRQQNVADRTLVIFISDNGGEWLSRNAPFFHRKDSLWEGGIRVPAILTWPAELPAGKISSQVAITMDLTATMLAVAGADTSEARLEGVDLLPLLRSSSPVIDRTLFWRISTATRQQRAVRSGDWKLLLDGGQQLLFDLPRDPGERNDLSAQHPDLVQKLKVLIEAWEDDVDTEATRWKKPAISAPPAPGVKTLQHDIDRILGATALANSYWGVQINSLANNETIYSLNARKLMMPASNMKIVTLAETAERLGWDYTYDTRLVALGAIKDGVLDGDLLVIGSGDPSVGSRDESASRLFDNWSEALHTAGVRTVTGRIIGDDNTFDDNGLGFGWSWDDLVDDYAAGVSALQFNENAVEITVAPGTSLGAPSTLAIKPDGSGLAVQNRLVTAAANTPVVVRRHRLPGSSRLELVGSVPLGSAPSTQLVSVDNPTLFFVNALRAGLTAHGIEVRGPAVDIDDLPHAPSRDDGMPIAVYHSPPLSALAIRLMKDSQNLYAETFLKTLGESAGEILKTWGLAEGSLIQRDGSGLSRYDYVTAEALVRILTHVAQDDRLRKPFEESLAVGGRDGTLENRMKGTPAEGNARAKTGSMSNVRAISGYVRTADGEPLVFSIMANNFDVPGVTITHAEDTIVARLAQFRR